MKIKNQIFLALISIFFAACTSLVNSSFINISYEEIEDKELVTYDFEIKQLRKAKYFEKNAQLVKDLEEVVFPKNSTTLEGELAIDYEKELRKIGCSIEVRTCIEKTITKNSAYFVNNEDKKVYILEKEFGFKVFKILKKY